MDVITGEKFVGIAKYTFAPPKRSQDDYDGLPNTLDFGKLKDGDIVYTHGIYLKGLLGLLDMTDTLVTVISHNSDINIDDTFILPSNVIKLYAQNVNVCDDRIEAIPIGLENDRWFPDVHKKERMIEALNSPIEYKNLVYMNFNLSTNFPKRSVCYNAFKDKSWVTTNMCHNGTNFVAYLRNLRNHKFVVCPEGNGLDTHRVWETLYMGSIPIVLNGSLSEELYSYFPCMIVDSWDEVTEEKLANEYKQITDIKGFYDHSELLTFSYWKNKILSST